MNNNNKTLDIFYIATGIYSSYIDNFLKTIHNFFPGYWKEVHVISNNLDGFNGKTTNDYKISVHNIIDMPYPIIPLVKTVLINEFINENMKYIFYFDADTMFMEKENDYWDELMEQLDNNQILMSIHPGNYYPSLTYKIEEKSTAYVSRNELIFSTMSSFFGANINEMKKFILEMNSLIKDDLQQFRGGNQYHYIPSLYDQDYANKIINTNHEMSFLLRNYIYSAYFSNEIDRKEEYFITQKYDTERKLKTKNVDNSFDD